MPPQDDETHDSADDSFPLHYTDDGGVPSEGQQQKQQKTLILRETDLDILHEIIALATTSAGPNSSSFRHIWRAYDAVLSARKINPDLDSVYYQFILGMQAAPGADLKEKFIHMLDKIGVGVDITRYTDFSSVPGEATTEHNKARYEEVKGRRDRARRSAAVKDVMQRWKTAFDRRQEQAQQAIDVYENNLVTRIYWQWYFAHLDTAVPQQYEERLARTVLYEWREKAHGIMQLHAMAEEFRRRKLLQHYFSHWVSRTDNTLEDQDRAMDYLEWNRQKRALDNWRKQATMALLVKGMQDVVKDRILYEHFSVWRQRMKDQVVAAEVYKQNLVQKAFRNWRLALRHDIMAEHHERTILRNTTQHWVRQERLQLLLRTHNRKLARGVVGLMAQRLKEKKDRLRYQKLLYLREREQMAANKYQTSLVEKVLYIWRAHLQHIRDTEQQAADAYFYFRTTKVLALWRARAAEARKARLKQAYQVVARNRKQRTALELFRRWRARSDQLWDLEADAEELNYRRLVGMAFSVWNDNLRRQQELELRAQVVVQESNLKLLLKYLKRWDTRYSRICWRREDAAREYECNQTAKALSIFRQWREKAYQRQQQQHQEDTFGRFADHASRSSAAGGAPPVPGMVTPRRGFKTPGWKTTGGTTMRRGVLGNRNLVLTANTPIGSPGSPLKRFGLFRRRTEHAGETNGGATAAAAAATNTAGR